MIEYNLRGYVRHELLDKEEARVFISFLEQEKARHKDDMYNIENTIIFLTSKFGGIK